MRNKQQQKTKDLQENFFLPIRFVLLRSKNKRRTLIKLYMTSTPVFFLFIYRWGAGRGGGGRGVRLPKPFTDYLTSELVRQRPAARQTEICTE
jgi:hypothetical protein